MATRREAEGEVRKAKGEQLLASFQAARERRAATAAASDERIAQIDKDRATLLREKGRLLQVTEAEMDEVTAIVTDALEDDWRGLVGTEGWLELLLAEVPVVRQLHEDEYGHKPKA